MYFQGGERNILMRSEVKMSGENDHHAFDMKR